MAYPVERWEAGAGNLRDVSPAPFLRRNEMADYYYIGDRFTDAKFKGAECNAVRRIDGKCIRGKTGSMLVIFGGIQVNVIGRLLRKIKASVCNSPPE